VISVAGLAGASVALMLGRAQRRQPAMEPSPAVG
jgi:hypothetical protein